MVGKWSMTVSSMTMEKISAFKWAILSGIHIAVSSFLMSYGPKGLIVSNMINMTLRIGWCSLFSWRHFSKENWSLVIRMATPRPLVWTALLSSFVVAKGSEQMFIPSVMRNQVPLTDVGKHCSIGVICFTTFAVSVLLSEQDFLSKFRRLLSTKSTSAKQD